MADLFLTRDDINPLFHSYKLRNLLEDITEQLEDGQLSAETAVTEQTDQLQAGLTSTAGYLEELGKVHRDMQDRFDTLMTQLAIIYKTRYPEDYSAKFTDTGDDGEDKENETDKLPTKSPSASSRFPPLSAQNGGQRRRKRSGSQSSKAKMARIKETLAVIVRDTISGTDDAHELKEKVEILGDSVREGKRQHEESQSLPVEDQDSIQDKKRKKKDQPQADNKKLTNIPELPPIEKNNKTNKTKTPAKPKDQKRKENITKEKEIVVEKERDEKERELRVIEEVEEVQREEQQRIEQQQLQEQEREAERERMRQRKEEEIRRHLEEEEQKRIEEAEKRKIWAEERKKKEQEEEERLRKQMDTNTWSTLRYDVDESEDVLSSGLGCTVKVVPETLESEALECYVHQGYTDVSPQEHRVSNIICLSSTDGHPVHFMLPAVIGIPYHAVDGLEPVVYTKEGRGRWMAVETETTEHEGRNLATFRRRRLKLLQFTVVMRRSGISTTVDSSYAAIKTDQDPNIAIRVASHTFTEPGQITLKVIPRETVLLMKSRLHQDGILEDISSVADVTVRGRASQPPVLEMGFTEENNNDQGLSKGLQNQRVHVMMSTDGSEWTRVDHHAVNSRDRYKIELQQETQHVYLLKTRGTISDRDRKQLVQDIGCGLQEFLVHFLFSQKSDNKNEAYLRFSSREDADKAIDHLESEGFTTGATTNTNFFIRDGARLMVRFNPEGNIDFADRKEPLYFTYLSKLGMRPQMFIHKLQVKNEYCQRRHASYCGRLQVYNTSVTDRGSHQHSPGGRTDHSTGGRTEHAPGVLLFELPVTLPKVDIEETQKSKATQYFYGVEPLTEEYVRHLAAGLADDWYGLASRLGLKPATIQHIHQRNPELDSRAFDMLRTWYMGSRTTVNKVDQLVKALEEEGLQELSQDLRERNELVMQGKRAMIREQQFNKIAKRISGDPRALSDWRGILLELKVDDNTVAELASTNENRIMCLRDGIMGWQQMEGDKASPRHLMGVLRKLGYHSAAEQVSFCIGKG